MVGTPGRIKSESARQPIQPKGTILLGFATTAPVTPPTPVAGGRPESAIQGGPAAAVATVGGAL